MLTLQEILIIVDTFDLAIFKNCNFAPERGGSTIIASYLLSSSDVKGKFFKSLTFVLTLFPKLSFLAAISRDFKDSLSNSNACI